MNLTRVLMLTFACAAVAMGQSASASPFNINDAYIAMEAGAPGNPFAGPFGGTLQAGYYADPLNGPGGTSTTGNPSTFTSAGMVHTDSFATNPSIEGYFIANNIIVPAVLVNTAATPLGLNFGGTIQGNQILLHPGNPGADGFALPASEAVLRYTSGIAGQYLVSGSFGDIGGGDVAVNVLLNGVTILTSGNNADTATFSQIVTLAVNDTLDFVVDDANGIGSDSTGLFANIAPVPEPASLILFGLGAVGLCAMARRQRCFRKY